MDRTNMPDAYLLNDKTWAAIEPLLPTVYAGQSDRKDYGAQCRPFFRNLRLSV
jgi:hypothetical protein